MPSRRISLLLAAALVLLVPLSPAGLWAQAPIKIGDGARTGAGPFFLAT